MSKEFYFFKRAVQNRLEDDTFLTLCELVESWTQNDLMAIFFIIFLGIIFEIILIKIYTFFHKKPALPEKGSSGAQEKKDSCLKSLEFDNWSFHPSSSSEKRFRVDDFSERTVTSSLTTEDSEGNFEDRVSLADKVLWSSASESKHQVSFFSESHTPSSNGTSSSLPLFHSEVKDFFLSHRGISESEHETVQFSSKKLFSIMKTNKNKNPGFSSDFNFSRSPSISRESEDSRESEGLDVAPCPPAHLLLSRDQVRLLEENLRNQIPLKSKTTLESKTTHPHSKPQQSLIQNQHSVVMDTSAQAQDSFLVQNAIQKQGFYEDRLTSKAQQLVNNQESVNSQPDIMDRYFALPQDLTRKPFSSSTQDSFQTQVMGRSQHLVSVPYVVETQDSIKGLKCDTKHLHESQYSVWFEDSNKIKHLMQEQNAIFKNFRFPVLTVSPNSFAEGMFQIRSVKPEGQQQISSELNWYSVYSSVPVSRTFKRQKNRRKALHSRSKLSLKVSSQKLKKPPTPSVFQITVSHTSQPGKLGCKHNAKKKELHQRKGVSDTALHLLYVSKLAPPYIKKYSRKKLVKVMPAVTGCRHSLLKQNKSLDAENVNCVGSVERRGNLDTAKNVTQHGRENEGQKSISARLPPWLEQSFKVNTFELKAPFSSLIEMNWKNKESFKDPITQEEEIGLAEFHDPNSKKTSDLHIPKHEAPFEEAISEPWQKFAPSPEMESNRRMETQEDLKSTENSHLRLSSGEELPTSLREPQRCFPNRNIQKQKDFLEIVLETSEVNLLISLGTKEQLSSEQLASVKTQENREDIIMKENKPVILHVTECGNLSESERLACNTRSTINMQDKRIFATFHNATNTTISEPPDMEMHSRLKAKTNTSTTGVSHSVVEQEKLPDEKKTSDAKYIEEICIFKKPQEHEREEEQTLQEAVSQLRHDFRVSLQLQQKPKCVRFEIKRNSSGSIKTPNKKQEIQPQTFSIETVVGTSSCPTMDPFQVPVKQSTDRPTGRETADPKNPLTVLENSPVGEVLIDMTELDIPFDGSPRKTPDDHIAEEKEDLKRVLPAATLGLFIIHMLSLSSFKRQKIESKLSGAKTVLSPRLVIMKVKKPANLLTPNISSHGMPSLRRRLRGKFKIIFKQTLQDKIVANVLVNVTYPHVSTVPRLTAHSRFSVKNHSHTKLNQEESGDERDEKSSDFIKKGNDSGNTLEEATFQGEERGGEEAQPEAILHDPWNLGLNANPKKELKTQEEMLQLVTSRESLVEFAYSPMMDLFHFENMKKRLATHVENMKKSLATQADLKGTADAEMPCPTSEKSLIGDTLNQTRESDVLDYGNDTKEMGYFSAATKAELPKDLPATYSETFNYHMPVLSHSKLNKNGVQFSQTENPVKPNSVPMNTGKPSISQVFNSTGHRKKLDSKLKVKSEKINQADGLAYDFINSLFSPTRSRLQGETNSFCHAQLKQGQFAEEVRPQYVDFCDKCGALKDQEEKAKDGKEVEQKTLLEAASQHMEHLWPNAWQGKETHLEKWYPALDSLSQELPTNEKGVQHQRWLAQTALQTGLHMAPGEAEELWKISQTEHAPAAPVGPKILTPKTENSSFDRSLNMVTECGLPSGVNPKRVPDSYFVENNSELPKDLQVTCPHSSGSVEPFVSISEQKKNTLELARKQVTVNCRYRAVRGKKPSVSHVLDGTQSKGLQCNFKIKMKKAQQNKNAADKFLNIIQSLVTILPNIKMSSGLNVETKTQRVTGLDHMQLMQEKLLTGGNVCCPYHIVSTLSNSMKDGGEEKGKQEVSPAPENSQGFIFNAYQEESFDLAKSDKELKQPQSRNLQTQPQIHGTQTVFGSASCPVLDQLPFGKLENYARFSPPKSEEVKKAEIVFSAREYGLPSDANHQKEQAGGIEKKDTVTFDSCPSALSIPRRERNFKYSDKRTSVNTKYGLLKAKKPSVSNIVHIKGAFSPNHRKELGCNPTTKMKEVDHGEKTAAKMYSFITITPDINTYNKIKREIDMLGERSLSAQQIKQAISPHEGNITSDDTKENSVQDEEENSEQETLKVILQHSQHFKFCSGQRKELDLHQSENQGSGKVLSVTEQDIPQQMQPTDSMQGEKPEKSHRAQNSAIYIASSKLPPLKSKDSLIGQVLMDSLRGGVPSIGNHMGELYSHGEEENTEYKKDLQAAVLESLEVSTPDLSKSKRQRKTFTSRSLKNKMSPKCVIMKARKPSFSPIFNISGNGCLKNLTLKTLKSQIVDSLIHMQYSGVLEDLVAEKKDGLAQELPAMILESLDLSILALPMLKRRRNNLKYIEKRNKMNLKRVTLKAKKAPISQTLNIPKHGIPSHRRQFKCNFNIIMKQSKPMADIALNAVSSPMPVSLDMKMHNTIKAESDVSRTMRFSHERQQQEQSPDGERASCAISSDRRGHVSRGMKEVKGQHEEATPWSPQHLSFIAGNMEEPHSVKSELEPENSARQKIPEPHNTAQELQQQALFTQSILHCVSCTILNSLPLEKLPKRTKAQTGLKYAKTPRILSPELGKSIRESSIITTQSDIPSERGPRRELARSIPEGKAKLQKDLQGRTLKFLDFSTPASSEFRRWRKGAQVPKSRTGKAQMASILKMIHITRSATLSHGKEQDCILGNMATEISQGMSDRFANTILSPTPVSPAIKTHEKTKAKRDSLKNKSSITQLEQHEGEKLHPNSSNKWSSSSSTLESRWQSGKEKEGVGVLFGAGLPFLCSTGRRKDQSMFITEQEVEQQTLASENKLESTCSPLIPFQTEELRKNIPPQKDILHRISQKISCSTSGNTVFDYFSTAGAECSTKSNVSAARKLGVQTVVSLPPEDKGEGIKTQKVVKHRVDQNILSTKSGSSVLGDPGDESSRRKMSHHIARKHRELQRDLLTMSTTSIFSDSIRQEKVLKFPKRRNLMGRNCVTMKAKKRLCSQMLHTTQHDNLYCRKEQDCNLKNKSLANAFLSPIPVSTDNKIGLEMHSTSEAEMDQLRVNLHHHMSAKLRKSPCDGETWKASSTDTQNRSSNTMRRDVQHEKEEENIQRMLLDSVPHYGQHYSLSAHQMKNPGSYQSESELNNSEVRRTWNLPCTAQNMRQEKCFRETVLEPVSRHVMNFLQVETAKKSLPTQEGIKYVEGLKSPLPKARKSETGSIQCGTLWDGNPRRKWDSPIIGERAWNQKDLIRTVLKPSDFASLDSSVPKSHSYTLEFVSKRNIINPKHITLKAKKRSSSQLLNITRCVTRSQRRKKGCTFQYKMKERQWIESVVEASLSAAEGTDIPPPKIVTDKHSFDTTARSTLYNRTLHKTLHGHTTEEEAELVENSATTFLGPLGFFTPMLSDSESQINTVQLFEEKINLSIKCSVMKKKEPTISQILKIRRQFTTKHRNKPGSNLKTKMKQMRQDKNVANTFPNTIDFTPDTPAIERKSRFKRGIDRVSRFCHTQPTHMELPTEGLVISQPLNSTSHAALSNNERQEKKIDRKKDNTVLYVDPKFIYDSMPIFSDIKMEPCPSTWGIYEETSEKGNDLNKANTSSPYACTPVYPQIIKHKDKAKTADVKNTMHTKWVNLKAKKPPVSQVFHTIGCRSRRSKKEQTCNIKKQKELQQDKTGTDIFLSTICDSGTVSFQTKQFTEVKREKGGPRNPIYNPPQLKLEKSLNKRKMSSSVSTDTKNAVSRNIKTLKRCISVQKENCQTILPDIFSQCRDQFVIRQVKKELDQVKIGGTLEREVYPGLASQKREIDYPRFYIPRVRTHRECDFLVAQRVKEEDGDVVECSVSVPWGTEVSEKTDASLSSKGQNIFLTELDASQQKTWKEQELPKQGCISMTNLESVAYPIMEPPHLKNTGKVAEEDMHTNKENISHLLRKEDIKETGILKGSKGQKFLYTNLAAQQNISAVQKGEAKPDDTPEGIVDSLSCPNRDNHFQITQAVNTRKEDVRISINLYVNPWRKEQRMLTDSPLRLNEQKMFFSEKLKAKQLHRSNKNKENILEFISSCLLHQLHDETLKKNVSAKRMSSKVLNSVVDKVSNETDTPVDQPSCSGVNLHNRRRKEPQKESTHKSLPTSVSYSSMDVLQIELPYVKKVLKAPVYHTSNIEGIGLLVEEKEEQPECIHQISPKPASLTLRDIFQSKIPHKEKASQEVVSTMDYIRSTENIGLLITRKENKVQIGKGKSCVKLTSLCASLPSLSHTNVNSRTKVGQDKSVILKICLPLLKVKVSPNVRKTLFAESTNRDSSSSVIESRHLPQKEKEDGENIVYVKDIMGLKCVTFKGKKTPLKYILHGQEPQWNREQEETMQKDKSDLDMVQNKRHASIPSLPHLEWIPGTKEVLMAGIKRFCLPSLTLKELSDAMGICEGPTDDILSSIKKAKYMPKTDRVEMALEEIKQPKRIVLKAKQSPIAQELQWNSKENEKNIPEDKDNQVGTQNTSRTSISFPCYSEVDINTKREEAMLIKTRSSFLQPELQESSDTEKIAYKQSIYGGISNSINKAKEQIMQEEKERVKKENIISFREKKSPASQETQLDIEEQEIKIQKIKEELNVPVTKVGSFPFNITAPSHLKLDTRMKTADSSTKVARHSLPELSHQESSDAVKKANKQSTDDDITGDVQEAKEYMLQKEKNDVEISTEGDMLDPNDIDFKRKKILSQDIPLSLKEQVKVDPESEEQERMDGGGKGEQEVVLPTHWASESSLTHYELDTRIEGEEDVQGITRSAVAQLHLQKSFDAGKIAYIKSTGDGISKDVKVVQEYEPEKGEDRRKIVNMKDRMYPKGTTSKEKVLPLPPELYTSGSCGSQITSIKEKLGNIQGKSELDKLLTRTSLLQFKLNKGIEGKEEKKGITRPFLPPSWHKESSNAEKLKYTVPPLNGISSNSKRTKYTTQTEEDKANSFQEDVMDPKYMVLRARKSPLFLILKTKKLQVNIKEQVKVGQEDYKKTIVLLSKIHPFITSSTHFKWDTIKDEEGEPGIIRNDVPHLELQESLSSGRIAPAPTDSPKSRVNKEEPSNSEDMESVEPIARNILINPQKGKHYIPPNEEGDGVETVNLVFPKHQEKKMQESNDESGVVLANSSSPSLSLSDLQLDKKIRVDDEMLVPTRSVVQRVSNAGEIVHTEAISGDVMQDSQNEKQHMLQEEEKDREKTMRSMMHTTDIILKSKKSPPSHMLHKTELHLIIGGQEQKKHEGQGKPLCTVPRKVYVSKPSANLTLDKGTQVDEKRLGIRRPSLLPCMLSGLSGTEKSADTQKVCDLRERKQHMSQKEKKYEVKTVDMRIRMHPREARISSISRIFNTKEFVLNIKEQKENVCKDKEEPPIVLTRTFLSVPSAPPLYLDSGNKIDKDAPGPIGSSLQQNLQESSDTQKTAVTEVVAGNSEIVVKKAKCSVPQEEEGHPWTSNFMISVQGRNEPPRVKSEGDLRPLVLNSQHEDIYLTGFGTISGERLEYFFTGQEARPEKYKTETFTTFFSYPTMNPAKKRNLKKETEIMDNINHKMSPECFISPPRKQSKEIHVTFGTPVCANGFSVSEQDAHQQKTLFKASPGSSNSYTSEKPEKEVHNHDKMNNTLSSKALASQTKGSLEKMSITESHTSPITEEQEIVMKKQVVLPSGSGPMTCLDSNFSLKFPFKNGRQKTPFERDVCKQTTGYPRIQILPGTHVDITVFDTLGGKKDQALPEPEQEECILESFQKSLSSHRTFPVQSEDLEGKKNDTSTTFNLEQKPLEMEKGELKTDTNTVICVEKDKTKMHKCIIVNLEENIKRDARNTVNQNAPSPKAKESPINTQVITRLGNSCPIKSKHKKDLEVLGAKQNIQPQKMFQKHILDLFYAHIPLSLKFEGWKGRLTIADLKRELSPKYLTMKIHNHPVSQTLNNTGCGTPSNRKKLEYDFSRPKKTVLWCEAVSGICIRSLSVSSMSSSQTEETVESETNLEREEIFCLSDFQQKSPNTSEIKKNSSSIVKEGCLLFFPLSESEANLSSETKENILIPQTKEESVVPGLDSSRIRNKPDLIMTEEEEKAPKPIPMPTEHPLTSDDLKGSVETHMESTLRMNISPPGVEETGHEAELFNTMEGALRPEQEDQNKSVQDTTTQKVQQQKAFLGTEPVPPQVKSNEMKVVADSLSAKSILPLYEAIKHIFESQIKNMIQDKICEDILENVKAHKPDAWKSPSFAGSPDITCMIKPPKLQPKPILEHLLPKENNKLTNHLESKAFEIKLNLIPEVAKISFQKFNFYLQQSISEHNSGRLYQRHKTVCFLPLEGIDTIEPNWKQKYSKDSPPVRCTKTLIVSVSSDGKEIVTNRKTIRKLESRASSVTSANEMLLTPILQNYSAEEKDKLLIHFSIKTLEIQMKAFPRIVRESCTMAGAQSTKKPLSKFVNSGVKVPKQKNKVLLLFEERSLHQIDLDLRYKYLSFLLGFPGKSMFPKPNALPKHTLKLNTVAMCKNIDNRGEGGGGLCIDTELLEQHISSKKQSPHENSPLMKKLLEPTHVCAPNPDQQSTAQKDGTVLSESKSHVTPEKEKQCHVWFQETNTYKSFALNTQETAPSLVDSHSIQISEDFTESQTNIQSPANLEECSALEVHESEECLFLKASPYLSQESQNILFELQRGIPLENLCKMRKSKTNLKRFCKEDSGSHHRIRSCREHSSIVTPSYESHKRRKYRSSDKVPFPRRLCHDSLNAVGVPSKPSSVPFGEEKTSWTTGYRTNYSVAPLTESNIKLHVAKSQGKPYKHLGSKERKKAKLDLFRNNNIHWDCGYSYTQNKEKCTRKKNVCNYEAQRPNHYPSKPKLPSKSRREDVFFHSERKQNQPFFYACIPADSLEIMPQTIRWTIPPRTLKKANFRVPVVAKISNSCNILSSSEKVLGSLLESFSQVQPD